jgi:hypothetical protein
MFIEDCLPYAEGVSPNSLGSMRSGAPQVGMSTSISTLKGFYRRIDLWNAFSVRVSQVF